jgi:hypothetical protein
MCLLAQSGGLAAFARAAQRRGADRILARLKRLPYENKGCRQRDGEQSQRNNACNEKPISIHPYIVGDRAITFNNKD